VLNVNPLPKLARPATIPQLASGVLWHVVLQVQSNLFDFRFENGAVTPFEAFTLEQRYKRLDCNFVRNVIRPE